MISDPVQIVSLSVKLAVGVGKTVKFCCEVSIHPRLSVTIRLIENTRIPDNDFGNWKLGFAPEAESITAFEVSVTSHFQDVIFPFDAEESCG